MFKSFAISQLAVSAAVIALGLASTGTANANNILINGGFYQVGQSNPACGAGASAAQNWFQFAVVPGSYLCTDVESVGFLDAIRVTTNGGDWPQAAMGNGFGQSFSGPFPCVTASFWVDVVAGEVTGNLVSATGPFVSYPVFKPTGGWKPYSQVGTNVIGLWFETLNPVGLIPPVNIFSAPVNYLVMAAQAQSCLTGPPPIRDLSQYLTYDPFYSIKNPGGPVAKTRITNTSSVVVQGPVHILLEGMTPRLSVVNPDGDYLGSPFINLVSGSLAPGQSEDVSIQFEGGPTDAMPSFRVQLASGAF